MSRNRDKDPTVPAAPPAADRLVQPLNWREYGGWTTEQYAEAHAQAALAKIDVEQSGTEWSVLFGLATLSIAVGSALVALSGGVNALDDDATGIGLVVGLSVIGFLHLILAQRRISNHERAVKTYKHMTYWLTRRAEEHGAPTDSSVELDPSGEHRRYSDWNPFARIARLFSAGDDADQRNELPPAAREEI